MQWLQYPNKINGDNLSNVKCETSMHFLNKNKEYLKEQEHYRDLYRGINEFKRGYQPRNNLVKDEKCNLLADSHNILVS
jgi:histone deacetylase complex regulatory component SIN3